MTSEEKQNRKDVLDSLVKTLQELFGADLSEPVGYDYLSGKKMFNGYTIGDFEKIGNKRPDRKKTQCSWMNLDHPVFDYFTRNKLEIKKNNTPKNSNETYPVEPENGNRSTHDINNYSARVPFNPESPFGKIEPFSGCTLYTPKVKHFYYCEDSIDHRFAIDSDKCLPPINTIVSKDGVQCMAATEHIVGVLYIPLPGLAASHFELSYSEDANEFLMLVIGNTPEDDTIHITLSLPYDVDPNNILSSYTNNGILKIVFMVGKPAKKIVSIKTY
jgi:hypothetical protein